MSIAVRFPRICRCLAVALIILTPTFMLPGGLEGAAEQAKQVPTQQAITVLQTLESRYRTIHYKVRMQRGYFHDGNDPRSFQPADPEEEVRLECALDLQAGKQLWRVAEHLLNKRSKKKKEHLSFLAFDGSQYRSWKSWSGDWEVEVFGSPPPGVELPAGGALGIISESKPPFGAEALCVPDVPPYEVYSEDRKEFHCMSWWLQSKKDSGELESIEELEPGRWRIRWRTTVRFLDKKQPRSMPEMVETIYELGRGGIASEKRRYDPTNGVVDYREVVELEQFKGEFWFPRVRYHIFPLGRPNGFRKEYTIISVNDQLDGGLFRPEFVKGTYVTDYIRKVSYIVGEPFDEAQAIRRFMQEHGLAAPPETPKRWPWWLWATGLGLLMLVLAALLAWRWRWLRSHLLRSSAVLLLGAGLCLTGFGQPPRQQASSAPAPAATKPPGTLS